MVFCAKILKHFITYRKEDKNNHRTSPQKIVMQLNSMGSSSMFDNKSKLTGVAPSMPLTPNKNVLSLRN